jgi:hypothetical protein
VSAKRIAAPAVAAVGLLAGISPPAQALPPLPLAPACAKFEFYQGRLDMWLDNGMLVTVQGYGTNVGNTAQYNIPNKTAPTYGTPSGGIIGAGDVIGINVNWNQGPGAGTSSSYTGQIDPNGVANGTQTDQNGQVHWQTRGNTFKCVPAAAEPAPPPADQNPPNQPPATNKATVTVLQPADVYDAPDGKGNRIGDESFFLRPEDGAYQLVEPCRNNWCHLVIPAAPGGQGWVYETGFLKLN